MQYFHRWTAVRNMQTWTRVSTSASPPLHAWPKPNQQRTDPCAPHLHVFQVPAMTAARTPHEKPHDGELTQPTDGGHRLALVAPGRRHGGRPACPASRVNPVRRREKLVKPPTPRGPIGIGPSKPTHPVDRHGRPTDRPSPCIAYSTGFRGSNGHEAAGPSRMEASCRLPKRRQGIGTTVCMPCA